MPEFLNDMEAPEVVLPLDQRPAVDFSADAVEQRKQEARIFKIEQRRQRHEERDAGPTLRLLEFVPATDLSIEREEFDDELVEGVLGRDSLAVIYGDSNCGKTFFAIELAARVSAGQQFLGHNTAPGAVLYLATEAPESVMRRFRAWRKHFGAAPPTVAIVHSPVNFFDGAADVSAVLVLAARVESLFGERVALIVGDTLARISAGANENSGEDMGVVLKNADAIRRGTGATVLFVHHSGKDQARGMRGWSGMRAAIDTEIEVQVDEATGTRTAEITKQRDIPGKGERIGFKLVPVDLGVNAWGTPRGSCVVEPTEAAEKRSKRKAASEIAGAIEEFLRSHGKGCLRGAVVSHFEGRYVRTSVYREIKKMVDAGDLIEVSGIVDLAGRKRGGK